jgi:hypothetical protein
MFHLFKEFGITPAEWRELDVRDATFLLSGYAEMNKREAQRIKEQNAKRRLKR